MYKLKSVIYSTVFLCLFSLGHSSASADEGDSYIDVSWGVTVQSLGDIKNITDHAANSSSNTRVDDEDEGFAVILGTMLTDSIAGEVSFVNLGEISIVGDDSNDSFQIEKTNVQFTGSETIKSEISGFGLGLAMQSGSESLTGSIRAGFLTWDASGTKADATDADTFVNSILFDSGTDPYVGLSAKVNISSFTLGVAYDSYGLNFFDDPATLLSASIGATF